MRLTTDRLVVRHFTPEDAAAFAAWRSDPEVARYQSWDAPYPEAKAVEFVRELLASDPDAPGWYQYAVEADGLVVGDVGVCLHENGMQAEIGYSVARAHQRRGYATEAVHGVLGFLFEERGLHRVSAECDAHNTPSAKLLTRLGFRLEGRRPENTWTKGAWRDDLLFGLLARDWHT
ncbi:GNAT family protein [Saccharothrix violaceirubra]|uniref:Aminoglycoside 6'-N-acetyltransferase n=1 Tax=Saccharothrix violaceirubra TaxID=413306 RepID=A0A7W7T7C7_9PSEU|nr:GNAT family protein [Saccharothrix violaceirubra]MBB4967927.1 aminoglycoside 6'-N-acetyltransferase [Saccharothrix violaceirubra]